MPRPRRVILSKEANSDLRRIAMHLEGEAGASVSRRWVRRLQEAATSLASLTDRAAASPHLGGRRRLVIRPYLIVYEPQGPEVVILRIVHGARNLDQLFADAD